MKIRLNKNNLAALPPPIRDTVIQWKQRYHKASIDVQYCHTVVAHEDAHLTAFGPDLRSQEARVGGEWAGLGNILPGRMCPLPPGCTVVETEIFLGTPMLTLYHNPHSLDTWITDLIN
jgi:hypothetical protein